MVKQLILQLTPTRRLFLIIMVSASPFFALMSGAKSTPAPMASLNLVNTLADAPDANLGDSVCDSDGATSGSQCTLRAAIQEANAAAGDDTITFDPSLSGDISLASALPDPNSNLSINGPGASILTVQRSVAGGTGNWHSTRSSDLVFGRRALPGSFWFVEFGVPKIRG